MSLRIIRLTAFALVQRVLVLALVFLARVLVQVEVSAKNELPEEDSSSTKNSNWTVHLSGNGQILENGASTSHRAEWARSVGNKR